MSNELEDRFKPAVIDILDRYISQGALTFGLDLYHHPIKRLFDWSTHRTCTSASPMTFNGSFVFASQNDLIGELNSQGYLQLLQGAWSHRVFSPFAWGDSQAKMNRKRWPALISRLAINPSGLEQLSERYAALLLLPGEDPPVLKRAVSDGWGFVMGDPLKADHPRLFFYEPSQNIRSYWPGRPDIYGCLKALCDEQLTVEEGAYG